MKKNSRRHKKQKIRLRQLVSFFFVLFFGFAYSQVTSSVDSTTIKIGEQILYKISVKTDTTDLVTFPKGQTFIPLEMVEVFDTDTTKEAEKYQLTKEYRLTQFDSGSYTIPQQKVIIGTKTFLTDSVRVEVINVEVDTTKQKLYDIKPIIEVNRGIGDWWKYLLIGLLILAIVGFLVYWFVWREKPLTEEEEIALLPPYDRAKLALKALDDSRLLEKDKIKAYYTELTMIIRKFIDEKVYDHTLESTTDELINRLQLLKDANQIELDKGTIRNIETIFKRADLVKFAKSKPDIELAKIDRNTIDLELDHVKESLPEPTEEELLLDQEYQEELARKKKRKQVIITAVVGIILVIGTITGFVIHYGFDYVKDTIVGHKSKQLLETKDWVISEYGAPPIIISTPIVLERKVMELTDEQKKVADVALFEYLGAGSKVNIQVNNTRFKPVEHVNSETGETKMETPELDLNQIAEQNLLKFESEGVANMTVRREQFITPNGQEGLKVFGIGDFPIGDSDESYKGNYIMLVFTTENILQQIRLVYPQDDTYADQIIERVVNSIELLKIEEEPKENDES